LIIFIEVREASILNSKSYGGGSHGGISLIRTVRAERIAAYATETQLMIVFNGICSFPVMLWTLLISAARLIPADFQFSWASVLRLNFKREIQEKIIKRMNEKR